ncbi:MAG TPA: proline--tRNA ligase, partial [Nitrospira sp.]|nr:proline--tRNA ligase [Nitrospira sp.]
DAYSFDKDEAEARVSYQKMYDAYHRVFTRCGLRFRAVEADTGLIGGTSSHEFMVLAETGEETIVYSETGTYAANVERAEVLPPEEMTAEAPRPMRPVETPDRRSVEEVTAFLQIEPSRLVKTLLYTSGKETVAVLVRGDHEANEIKLKRLLGVTDLELAGPATVERVTGAPVGFAGPIGLKDVRILADHAVKAARNVVVGANRAHTHYVDANWNRDFHVDEFADLRNAQAGDPSPRRDGILKATKGIEVGHVFMLGTKYSQLMNATYLDPNGKECLAVMGCYGIGVGRTAAAAVEQHHDDKGIIWPIPIAPFHVHLLPLGQSAGVIQATERLYAECQAAGLEVLWDDRDERAGVKFNDADLVGAPFQIIVGEKGLADGTVEVKLRQSGEKQKVRPAEAPALLLKLADAARASLP